MGEVGDQRMKGGGNRGGDTRVKQLAGVEGEGEVSSGQGEQAAGGKHWVGGASGVGKKSGSEAAFPATAEVWGWGRKQDKFEITLE